MNIVFQFDAGKQIKTLVEEHNHEGFKITYCSENAGEANDKHLASALEDADVLWHVLAPVTKAVLDRAPNLKLIQKVGVGVNTIDLEEAKARGIRVCNMPGSNSNAVAEVTVMLILATLKQLTKMDRITRSGQWRLTTEQQESLSELRGKTVGFFGFGSIPRLIAPILEAMGAKIIYTATQPKDDVGHRFVEFSELLQVSDVLTLHAGFTESTASIMNDKAFASMKPGAVFINTSRGGLVNEKALHHALTEGTLAAAGLDVFVEEPALASNPLLALENVIVSPHVAWLTQETWQRSIAIAMENSQKHRDGDVLIYPII
ncbi:hypothetical protein A9Q99_01180 [Gammaproteobacteria bacterium 45_16_T64]|nr:hypothetical protein A9Q99_01180 [Gammaproteobacteria bacterium 45_16_T64]